MGQEIIKNRVIKFQEVLLEFPEFKYLGDPVLRTPTQEVTLSEGLRIGKTLGETLIKYRGLTGFGRGLAAPQLGIAKSVFVTYVNDEVQIYINPKLIQKSEETNLYRELCLSSGIMWGDIERPSTVKMEWIDGSGLKQSKEFDQFLARLLQHEEEHLRGICNLDKAIPGTIEIQLDDPLQEKLRS